jgi:hypothetical protein
MAESRKRGIMEHAAIVVATIALLVVAWSLRRPSRDGDVFPVSLRPERLANFRQSEQEGEDEEKKRAELSRRLDEEIRRREDTSVPAANPHP